MPMYFFCGQPFITKGNLSTSKPYLVLDGIVIEQTSIIHANIFTFSLYFNYVYLVNISIRKISALWNEERTYYFLFKGRKIWFQQVPKRRKPLTTHVIGFSEDNYLYSRRYKNLTSRNVSFKFSSSWHLQPLKYFTAFAMILIVVPNLNIFVD